MAEAAVESFSSSRPSSSQGRRGEEKEALKGFLAKPLLRE